jgi:hypothetical protein
MQDLIASCKVVTEANFKRAIMNAYQRKKAFKRMPLPVQNSEGEKVELPNTTSMAAWFDLNQMRKDGDTHQSEVG